MPENDEWKSLALPIVIWSRLHIQMARILLANGEVPANLTSEDKKARTAARVDAMEFLVLLCERTESDSTFKV